VVLTNLLTRRRKEDRTICPRCGQPGYPVERAVGERKYIYFYHGRDENGRLRWCYVGPVGSYEYVSKTHDIDLYGYMVKDRYVKYLDEIIKLIKEKDIEDPVQHLELVMKLVDLSKKIEKLGDEKVRKIIDDIITEAEAVADKIKNIQNEEAQKIVEEMKRTAEELENNKKVWMYIKRDVLIERVKKLKELIKTGEKYL